MSRPFTRSQAKFTTPVKETHAAPIEPKMKPKKQINNEDKKEVKRQIEFTEQIPSIVMPEEVKEMCLCGPECNCEACYYEFYAERNQIHHDHSDKGEICYGTECKMCPHSVIPEQWDWETCDTNESSSVGMGTTQIFKFDSNIKTPSPVGMGTTVFWSNDTNIKSPSPVGMGTTAFWSNMKPESTEVIVAPVEVDVAPVSTEIPKSESVIEVPNTKFWKNYNSLVAEEYDLYSDSDDSDSDYVPSESCESSDSDSDESQEWNTDEEYDENCEDILTSQMLDLYGRIYYVREQLYNLNKKSKIDGKWTNKMDTQYENLLQPMFNDEWYNELQRIRKTLGKYSTRAHIRMIYDMNEMVEEISSL